MLATELLKKDSLSRLTATGGDLNAPLLFLFQNDFAITEDTLFTDLVEADFDGYTRPAALTFAAPFENVDGQFEIDAPSVPFIATGDTTPNVIYGWGIVTATLDKLLVAERLPVPVAINETDDGLVVLPRFIYGS